MTEKRVVPPDERPRVSGVVALWLIVPLVLGSLLSALVVPVPKVGIIRLEGEIADYVADSLVAQINYARTDPSIRAVVLNINSPGGGVTASENIYFSLLSLRETKPVIVSADTIAASGAYFAAAAGQEIFAKPSSSVGNVGVVSVLPSPSYVDEELISTGPFKLFGSSRSGYTGEMEMLKEGFLRSVMCQRGDRLKISDDEHLTRGAVRGSTRAGTRTDRSHRHDLRRDSARGAVGQDRPLRPGRTRQTAGTRAAHATVAIRPTVWQI